MKATELMIGDLVLVKDAPRKVAQLTKHKIGYHLTERECVMHYARLCEIKPIPITAKILEKSGWKITDVAVLDKKPIGRFAFTRGDFDYEVQYRIGHYFRLDVFWKKELLNPNEVYTFFPPVTIVIDHNWYIHELQHALRLLGLTDLADNFKI